MRLPKLTGALLLLNLAMLAGILWHLRVPAPPTPPRSSPAENSLLALEPEIPAPSPLAAAPPPPPPESLPFQWAQLESEDYRTYVERLRSIGCPEQTIRDIIIADLDKLLAPRIQAVSPRRPEPSYWQPEDHELANDVDAREVKRKKREIDHEKRLVIEELLGIDLVQERARLLGEEDFYSRRLSFLPESKRTQVRILLEKFNAGQEAIQEEVLENSEPLSPIDRAKIAELEKTKQQELAHLLTPTELEALDLWISPAADTVRRGVYGMQATEEEFLKIYRLQKQFDSAWNESKADFEDPLVREKWEASKNLLDQEIEREIGPGRFREYQRGQDPEYHALNAALTRFKLPKPLANEIHSLKRAVLEQLSLIETDLVLPPESKQTILDTIRAETDAMLLEKLGKRAFDHLKNQGYAHWVPL